MNRQTTFTMIFLFLPIMSFPGIAADTTKENEALMGPGYGVVGASLAKAEEAICRSMVNYAHVRGAFGEMVMEKIVLGSRRGGGWQTVCVSPQPQGIDGLYLKRDSAGNPRQLLVGEAKFGTAQLGMTKSGLQLGTNWTPPRIKVEALRHQSAGQSGSVVLKPQPRGLNVNPDTVKVRLPDGQRTCFWRENRFSAWNYDGPEGTLRLAQKSALNDGRFLQAAADGRISYRQQVFNVDVKGDTISVTIKNAEPTSPNGVRLTEIARVKISAANRVSFLSEAKAEIARQLMAKNPHLAQAEAQTIANNATRQIRHLENILRQQNRSYFMSGLSDFGKAGLSGGLLAGVLDAAIQTYSNGQVDWARTGGMTLLGASSSVAGSATYHMILRAAVTNAATHQFFVQTASAVGLPTGMAAANIFGQGMGGAAGSAVFAVGMWLTGNMTASDATRCVAAGTIGSATGAVAGAGMILFATTYGTAGTGVAISTLSGAAANSAALAWLGGGSLAAGGGGSALGSVVLSGGIAAVAIVAAGVIYWGFAKYDNSEVNHRHQYTSDYLLKNTDLLNKLSTRVWFPNESCLH